jgi:hypothetical protein
MGLFRRLLGGFSPSLVSADAPPASAVERHQLAPYVTVTVKYPTLTDDLPQAVTSTRWSAVPGVQSYPTYGLWRIVGDPFDDYALRRARGPGALRNEWRENDLLMFIGSTVLHVRRCAFYHMDSPHLQWLFENAFTRGGLRIAPDCTPIIVTLSTPEKPEPFRWFPPT